MFIHWKCDDFILKLKKSDELLRIQVLNLIPSHKKMQSALMETGLQIVHKHTHTHSMITLSRRVLDDGLKKHLLRRFFLYKNCTLYAIEIEECKRILVGLEFKEQVRSSITVQFVFNLMLKQMFLAFVCILRMLHTHTLVRFLT